MMTALCMAQILRPTVQPLPHFADLESSGESGELYGMVGILQGEEAPGGGAAAQLLLASLVAASGATGAQGRGPDLGEIE